MSESNMNLVNGKFENNNIIEEKVDKGLNRLRFMALKMEQKEGERLMDWMARVFGAAIEARLNEVSLDDAVCLIIMLQTHDDNLRSHLMSGELELHQLKEYELSQDKDNGDFLNEAVQFALKMDKSQLQMENSTKVESNKNCVENVNYLKPKEVKTLIDPSHDEPKIKIRSHCDECGKNVLNIYTHTWRKHLRKSTVCPKCNANCTSHSDLKIHMKIYHKSLCPECGGIFMDIRKHLREVHKQRSQGKEVQTHSCPQCDYTTVVSHAMNNHIEWVHKKVRSTCDICGKEVADVSKHVRIVHQQVKNFGCGDCGYKTTSSFFLKRHQTRKSKCVRSKSVGETIGDLDGDLIRLDKQFLQNEAQILY